VNELKQLWDGVWAYDGRKTTGGIPREFRLKAICMWTMHDYPSKIKFMRKPLFVLYHSAFFYSWLFWYLVCLQIGFGFVSGLQIQGYKACSTCGLNLQDVAVYSSHLCKVVYLGNTKFLPLGHDMRSYPLLFSSFSVPYGDERDISEVTIFLYWSNIANRVTNPDDAMVFEDSGLTRWGILNSLSYPSELKIWHLLDPMHIKGNVRNAIIRQLYEERDKKIREALKISKIILMSGLVLIQTQVLSSNHQLHEHLLHEKKKGLTSHRRHALP
jgi:hypothetical protein